MPDRLPLVLVCDDTPAKRYVLSSWLRRAGYRVVEVGTAAEARQVLQERAVDLAVLDVHLPDGSGLDVTRSLRADPTRSATPVVHVSAVAVETLDKVTGLDIGADAYLVDPIDPQELLGTIRALLRSSGARRDAEELAGRMSVLNRAAVRLNVAATVARLAEAVAKAAAEVFAEPAVAVLGGADGDGVRAAAVRGGSDVAGSLLSAEKVGDLVGRLTAAATVAVEDEPWAGVLPGMGPDRWRVWPVSAADECVGLVSVPASDNQSNDDFLLERLAQFTLVALDNLRTLEREHQTAMMLQRSLLPIVLPQPAGIGITARYRASQQHAEVGGDFFDALEVDDGCLVVIGDVQGHSLEAAVVMAELRYSLRAYAYDGYAPEQIASRLNALLLRNEPGLTATACIGLVAADRRSMRLVNAGHPPMQLIRGGRVLTVDDHDRLLGFRRDSHYTEQMIDLAPGDRLIFMTDGLIERRDEEIDDSLRKVGTVAAATAALDGDEAADRLLAEFGASDDDVALLIVDLLDDHPETPLDC